jgi:hypothetical protein
MAYRVYGFALLSDVYYFTALITFFIEIKAVFLAITVSSTTKAISTFVFYKFTVFF